MEKLREKPATKVKSRASEAAPRVDVKTLPPSVLTETLKSSTKQKTASSSRVSQHTTYEASGLGGSQQQNGLGQTVMHSSSSRHHQRGIEMNEFMDRVPDYRRKNLYSEAMSRTQEETFHALRTMKSPPSLPKSQQTIMCTDDLKLVPIEKPKKVVKEKEENGIWSSVKGFFGQQSKPKELEIKEKEMLKQSKDLSKLNPIMTLRDNAFELIRDEHHLLTNGHISSPDTAAATAQLDYGADLRVVRRQRGGGNIASNGQQQNQQGNPQQQNAQIPVVTSAQLGQGMEQGVAIVLANYRQMEADLAQLRLSNQQLQSQVAENTSLRQQNQTQATTIESLRSDVVTKNQTIENLTRENELLEQTNNQLEARVETYEREVANRDRRINTLEADAETAAEVEGNRTLRANRQIDALTRESALKTQMLDRLLFQPQNAQPGQFEWSRAEQQVVEEIRNRQQSLANQQPLDAIVRIGGREFQVNRALLSNCSAVIKALFDSAMEQEGPTTIEPSDVSITAMKVFIDFLNTGKFDGNFKTLNRMLDLARQLEITMLQTKCAEKLVDKLNKNNILPRLYLFVVHCPDNGEVREALLNFIDGMTHDQLIESTNSPQWISLQAENGEQTDVVTELVRNRIQQGQQNQ